VSFAPQTFGCEVITGGRVRRIGGAVACGCSGRRGDGVHRVKPAASSRGGSSVWRGRGAQRRGGWLRLGLGLGRPTYSTGRLFGCGGGLASEWRRVAPLAACRPRQGISITAQTGIGRHQTVSSRGGCAYLAGAVTTGTNSGPGQPSRA
jgi:hypothetical protein